MLLALVMSAVFVKVMKNPEPKFLQLGFSTVSWLP